VWYQRGVALFAWSNNWKSRKLSKR
jgi:hypothetical protein